MYLNLCEIPRTAALVRLARRPAAPTEKRSSRVDEWLPQCCESLVRAHSSSPSVSVPRPLRFILRPTYAQGTRGPPDPRHLTNMQTIMYPAKVSSLSLSLSHALTHARTSEVSAACCCCCVPLSSTSGSKLMATWSLGAGADAAPARSGTARRYKADEPAAASGQHTSSSMQGDAHCIRHRP
jgi:hypothetical protein